MRYAIQILAGKSSYLIGAEIKGREPLTWPSEWAAEVDSPYHVPVHCAFQIVPAPPLPKAE